MLKEDLTLNILRLEKTLRQFKQIINLTHYTNIIILRWVMQTWFLLWDTKNKKNFVADDEFKKDLERIDLNKVIFLKFYMK